MIGILMPMFGGTRSEAPYPVEGSPPYIDASGSVQGPLVPGAIDP